MWVLIYLTVVILLMTLVLPAGTDTLTLQGVRVPSGGLNGHKSAKGIMQCAAYSMTMLLFLCLFLICGSVILSI